MGFALCGSFCTHQKVLSELQSLSDTYDIIPIVSETAATTDTRFGTAADLLRRIEAITAPAPIRRVPEGEPFGPKAL